MVIAWEHGPGWDPHWNTVVYLRSGSCRRVASWVALNRLLVYRIKTPILDQTNKTPKNKQSMGSIYVKQFKINVKVYIFKNI